MHGRTWGAKPGFQISCILMSLLLNFALRKGRTELIHTEVCYVVFTKPLIQ